MALELLIKKIIKKIQYRQKIMKENRWVSDVHEIQNKDMKINSPAYKVELPHMLTQIL